MFYKQSKEKLIFYKLTPTQILAIGFAAVILVGAILLHLPISSADGTSTPFIDCIFVSTSATCVTGLVTVDTGTHWSFFGQIVIMLLIETGGLGFMTFATFFAVIVGKKISLKERLIIQEAYNAFDIQGMVRLALYVLGITLTIEGIGAVLLATQFVPDYGWVKGIYFGIFHSVSAFCNAGFDLIGKYRSITPYVNNAVVTLTIGGLIVLGGIGFAVIIEVLNIRRTKRFSLSTKIVLTTTALLIVGGAILFYIFESNNPKTMGVLGLKGKILASIFASITPRTAGYNSISTTDMTIAGKFLTIILMFIGASPGSTGGGIKTTTTTLLFMTVIAIVRGKEDTEIYKRRINKSLVYKAISIFFISLTLVVIVTMILAVTQKGSSLQFLYEATSAFGTVGLTLGFTPTMTPVGKAVIAFTMYAGRVGPLTLAVAFAKRALSKNSAVRYPEDRIIVG